MATAEQRYRALEGDRNYYLDRARRSARLTIPYLIPTSNEPTPYNRETYALPWNGIGARGVLNLASRMLLALLPPTEAFFRFTLDEVKLIEAGIDPSQRSEFELALARMEREVLRSIETSNDRVAFHEALLHLVVGGNVLLYVSKEGLRVFHLNRYVCSRDPMGNPLEVVTCEELAVNTLPPEAKAVLEAEDAADVVENRNPTRGYDKTVKIFTHVEWSRTKVTWYQELKGKRIPGTDGSAPISSNPWMPLRMSRVDGQPYGVSYVESAALADLSTAESLSQAVAEGALAHAKIVYMVRPNGVTRAKDIADAPNGAVVSADANDVECLQSQKGQDMQVAMQGLARIEARLAQAFMLADVRDSERTTAEEVRLQALQIENSLGSIYSILTTEFQVPYVTRKLDLLTREGKLPKLPKDLVKPVVSVGLAAVGRGNDLEKIVRFVTTVGQTMGPEALQKFVNPSEMIKRLASSLGIDILGLVKTEDELAQEQELQQRQAMAQQLMASPAGDPQKLAQAAATVQGMQQQQAQPAEPGAEPAAQPTPPTAPQPA